MKQYGVQIWNGNRTVEHSNDIERIQKRTLNNPSWYKL